MADGDDLRLFIRDIATRHERIWSDQAQVLRELLVEMKALRKETHEDHRGQLQALMHILDRLQNGGAAA